MQDIDLYGNHINDDYAPSFEQCFEQSVIFSAIQLAMVKFGGRDMLDTPEYNSIALLGELTYELTLSCVSEDDESFMEEDINASTRRVFESMLIIN